MKRTLVTAAGSLAGRALIGRVSSQTIQNNGECTARATKGVADVNNGLFVGTIRN